MKIGKINISRTWLVIIIVVLAAAGYFIIPQFFKNPLDSFITEKAGKGEVLQEVSDTGSVRAAENISMSFKVAGRIAKLNVSAGSVVKKGDVLAELDSGQAYSQLQNAKAALDEANTQYNKLLKGLTPEDIKTYNDAVDSAKQDLDSEYASALNALEDAYAKIYNSLNAVNTIQNNYFSFSDQQSVKVNENKNKINSSLADAKNYLDIAKTSNGKSDIDNAISKTINALSEVSLALKVIRDAADEGIYYNKVSSTDKTSLETHKTNINTALTSVTTAQNNISSDKIALQKAEDNLTLKTATPRTEDIDIYLAKVKQAQANVDLYQNQLSDLYLRSPIDARITGVDVERGEVILANTPVVNLLSSAPFQIKVDIYEQDIVNVNPDNPVKINLVAFPKETFFGKVLSVDPGEKIIDNVVYYEVTIDFPNQPQGVKSGMTADIVIETSKKNNVLRVPKNAVENIDGRETVQVVKNGKIENREITTGLEGNDYFEVALGLDEGDMIITGKK